MKKSGFTIIELIICFFIITALFTLNIPIINFMNTMSRNIQLDGDIYEVENLLSYGKAICKEKKQYGSIKIDKMNNTITFNEINDNIKKTIKLSKDNKFTTEANLIVSPKGTIDTSTTIMILYKEKERRDISIRVGVDLITINEGT